MTWKPLILHFMEEIIEHSSSTSTICLVSFWSVVDVIKLFLEEFPPKLSNWIKFDKMSEPAQKYQNNVILSYTLFICSKMTYYYCFSLAGNLDFLDFLQKSFFNTNYSLFSPIFCTVVNVIKLFWRKSGNSRFPTKLKQQF